MFFFKSIVTAPTIGFRLDVPKYHFGVETNYYQATVSSTDYLQYQGYGKTFFDVGLYGSYKNFKFHLFYANHNFRNIAYFGAGDTMRFAFKEFYGLALSYKHGPYEIVLRNDQIWTIEEDFIVVSEIAFGFNLKLIRSLALTSNEKKEKKTVLPNLINLQVGLNLTGNELNIETTSMLPMKIAPMLGVEFTYRNYQLYMRRAYWQNINISYDAAGKYTSLYNQIGLAYQVSLKKEINFFVGLHHFWNYTRGQQFLDFRENGILDEILGILPQNKGIGLELKYPFANNIDFILDADYYYEAHPRLGTGFNRESFRLSAIYNFR
jgi:hypothetical protein